MNLAGVLKLARDRLGDQRARGWSNDELVQYVNLGQEELARRGLVLRASSTITLVADKLDYTYPDNTIDVLQMERRGNATPITRKSTHEMRRRYGDWRAKTGTPIHYISDRNTKGFTLYRVPDAADIAANGSTLDVVLTKLPSTTLVWPDNSATELEVPAEYHFDVVEYVCWRAFEKEGQGTRNPEKARQHQESFEKRLNMARRESMQRYYAPGVNTSLRRYYG